MSNPKEKETKLAPIFGFKSNQIKEKANEKNDEKSNKRKRKKKSPKIENKNKTNKKLEQVSDCLLEEEIDCRRSKRLRNRDIENPNINYNEESDEEIVYNNENSAEIIEKLNESVVLLEESSDTIDYWDDDNNELSQQNDSTDDDIEILPSNQSEITKEFLLWTEKYKPNNVSEVIGHKVAVNRLKSWLEEWVQSVSPKQTLDSEDDSDNGLDETNACLLICGPTGCGKTSMVYAVAEELKYEILELNASMKRNGRVVSKILGEATQSHQMQRNIDSNGSTPSIQSFFNSVANNRVDNDIKVLKHSKKSKPKGILNYFSKQTQNSAKSFTTDKKVQNIQDEIVDKTESQSISDSVLKVNGKSSNDPIFAPKALSIASNSLILFDDIDVMIDDDFIGFWNAFNRITEITKKPVILTATQYVPYIKSCVNRLQVLTLSKPNALDTINGLKKICDKELSEETNDFNESFCQSLSANYDYDIRRCLNELQFGANRHQINKETKAMSDKKFDFTSYYDSLLFADVMQTQFGIVGYSENRDNWMKCKPTFVENESHTTTVAKDIIESFNEFSEVNKRINRSKELSKTIDYETVDSISQYLSPNINMKTIILDYCPYLSLICESESIRNSVKATQLRRCRRFMHHLDSIGFYIDNMVKTKLISAFISEESKNILDKESEDLNCGHKLDDYYYE